MRLRNIRPRSFPMNDKDELVTERSRGLRPCKSGKNIISFINISCVFYEIFCIPIFFLTRYMFVINILQLLNKFPDWLQISLITGFMTIYRTYTRCRANEIENVLYNTRNMDIKVLDGKWSNIFVGQCIYFHTILFFKYFVKLMCTMK